MCVGLQEYIEALSFCHYIEHGTLISLQEVRQTLKFCVSNEALEQKDTSVRNTFCFFFKLY